MTVSLVIGGASGIGRAIVTALHSRGDIVGIVDIDDSGESVARELGERATFIHADMSTANGPRDAVENFLALSGGKLDVLYYGPAVLESHPLSEWTIEQWDHSMSVNLRGAFFACQSAEKALRASSHGRVILMSSTGALRGHAGMPAYHASKSGMLGLVRALADELAPTVTVNAVCPGWIDTPFNDPYWSFQDNAETARTRLESGIPAGRQGIPEDVAGIIEFMTTPAANYITGQSFVVDGGYTAV
ncbi:unannotated protein [freshwater metagenome]|uniref:Unannotated protein n=1 Tax=freshwater metagenome TaxID=449393 RepID=A0A6J7CUA3_9ZZZZ